jgi:hypothetical protein
VVSDDTIAPISNPDPIPVEVIKALPLVGVLLVELGETTELMGFTSARYVAQFIGNFLPDLSKRRTKNGPEPNSLGALIDDDAGNADAARQGRELAGREFSKDFAVSGIDLLDELVVRVRSDAKLVGFPRIVEILIEQLNLGL